MSNDHLTKLQERDRAIRKARDEMLRRVALWLTERDFQSTGIGHFTRAVGERVCHIGFQKLRSGRHVRVSSYISDAAEASIDGPRSNDYELPNSPNGRKYWFAWSTREPDIARCVAEYCDYLKEVVLEWFTQHT